MVRVLLYGDVAQPAEQFLHTEKVGGSVPSVTTNYGSLVKWILHNATNVEVGVWFSQDPPEPAGVTSGYCDPQEGEVSSWLKGGTTLTEVALAIREFFLVGKRVEGTCDERLIGVKPDQISDVLQLPPQKESNAVIAQRKSIRLISERPTFRNCLTVPILSRWCNGSIAVSKTVGWGSSP